MQESLHELAHVRPFLQPVTMFILVNFYAFAKISYRKPKSSKKASE